MGAVTGKWGYVNGKSTTLGWQVDDAAAVARQKSSSTGGGYQRFMGAQSWSGSYRAGGASPAVMPGESFAFSGFTAPDDGVGGNDGQTYSGTARVTQVAINWAWTGDAVLINHEVSFMGDLALAIASATYTEDSTDPVAEPTPISAGVKYAVNEDEVTWTTLANVSNVSLNLINNVQPVVNSSTVVSDVLWTGTREGGFDWTCDITVDDNVRYLEKGEWYGLQLFTNATEFWQLQYGRVMNYSGLVIDVENDSIIQQTANLGMHSHNGANEGEVIQPDLTSFWP